MYCKACGKQIDDDSAFCKVCGAPQTGGGGTRSIQETEIYRRDHRYGSLVVTNRRVFTTNKNGEIDSQIMMRDVTDVREEKSIMVHIARLLRGASIVYEIRCENDK